ncbi:unnamed protein product [Amoebophrya sp. A120]|nr:unnamed protein product [Amoebophrya sp. A120]|eukprot:GSA120T00003364001.1
MFDVDLTEESEQCLGASEFTVCVERSTTAIALPEGWSVSAANGGGTPRRKLQLQATESVLGLTVSTTLAGGAKKVFPLAALDSNSKAMHVAKGLWVGFNDNEGFDATRKADPHDECRHITCPAGEQCFKGAAGQNPCFPSLFTTANGDSRSLMQQLVRLAGSSYATDVRVDDAWTVTDLYAEDGWQVQNRFCLTHDAEFPAGNVLQLKQRKDCAVVSKKNDLCAISFQGSDDDLEPIEPAFKLGTIMINGYEVWRGCAREYKRFKEHPDFANWMTLAQDSAQCNQVYITGHSLGAAVAVLHRLDIEFGRLVTFAAPPVFAPYSYPQYCFGDSFHMQQDIVKAFPLGFRLGGVREHSMCTAPTGVMHSKGCNGFELGEVNFCDIFDHHVLSKYRTFVDTYASTGLTPAAGQCATTTAGEWIDKCVTDKCAAHDPQCAMGAEVLRSSLAYESMRATAITQLRPGQPPALAPPASLTANKFSVPDVQALELQLKNPNLCPAVVTGQHPASSVACVALDDASFLLAHASKTSAGTAVEVEASYYGNVAPAATAVTATATLVLHVAVLLPEENAVFVQVYAKNAPALRLEYKLTPQKLLCRGLDASTKVCLVYELKDPNTNVYSVDFYAFVKPGDSAYKVHVAEIDAGTGLLTAVSQVAIAKEFGNLEQKFLDRGYAEMEQSLSLTKSTEQSYCAKIVPAAFCNYEAGERTCDAFRNAKCLRGGLCGCAANMCANDQGVCVPDTAADAKRTVGHPCIEKDQDFELFQLGQDPSYGAPYERCAILGEKSFVRVQYPDETEVMQAPTDVSVSALVKVGFSVVPLSFERQLRTRVRVLATAAGAPNLGVDLEETDLESGQTSSLFSQVLPLTDQTEACTQVNGGGTAARTIPIADLCVRSTGAGGRLRARQLTSTGAAASTTTVENTISVGVCVPALYNTCYNVPVAQITSSTPTAAPASSSRRLQEVVGTQYSVSPVVPAVDEPMQESDPPQSGSESSMSPALIMFISIVGIATLVTLISAGLAWFRPGTPNHDKGRTRGNRLSTSSIAGEDLSSLESVDRPSPVLLARLENPQLFSRFTGKKDCVWTCAGWIPKDANVRKLLLNAWPMHVARVFFRSTKVIQLPLFPDEKYWTDKNLTPTIRSFLAFRRSILMIFVGLAFVIVAMGAVQELPQVCKTLFSGEEESLTHEDVKSMLDMFRTAGSGFGGDGAEGDSRRRVLTEVSASNAAGTARRYLQVASAESVSAETTPASPSANDDYTVEQAFEVKRRLSVFYTLMYIFKLFVAAVTLYAAIRALNHWRDYKASAKWTILALTVRLTVTVVLSWLPWFYMLFPDSDERPEFLNVAARLFIDVMLNLPVASVGMMVTPGVVGGARLVMELLPFTIFPYMIIFVVPLLAIVMLWPVLSIIGHGMGNLKLLYGSLIYVGYCGITSWAAFRALASLEAFRLLGRKAVEKTGVTPNRDEQATSPALKSGNPSPVSSAGSFLKDAIPTLLSSEKKTLVSAAVGTEKEPVVNRRGNLKAMQQQQQQQMVTNNPMALTKRDSNSSKESCASSQATGVQQEKMVSRKSLARRGSGAMTDIGNWVMRKMKSTEDLDDQTQLPSTIFDSHGSSGATAATPGNGRATKSRQSVELREAIVQGTLMSHLHSKMLPKVTKAWFTAFALFWLGLSLVLWGIYEEAQTVMDVVFRADSFWGTVVTMAVDAVINVLMIRICFTDLIFAGLVKLRLFNGYMADDLVLSSFCALQGYSSELNKAFNLGAKQMHRQLSMEGEDSTSVSPHWNRVKSVFHRDSVSARNLTGVLTSVPFRKDTGVFGAGSPLRIGTSSPLDKKTPEHERVDAAAFAQRHADFVSNIKNTKRQSSIADTIKNKSAFSASERDLEPEHVFPTTTPKMMNKIEVEEEPVKEDVVDIAMDYRSSSGIINNSESSNYVVVEHTASKKEHQNEIVSSTSKPSSKPSSVVTAPESNVVVGTPAGMITPAGINLQTTLCDANQITAIRSPNSPSGEMNNGQNTTTIVATNSTIVFHTSGGTASGSLQDLLQEINNDNGSRRASELGITAIVGGPDNILVRRNSESRQGSVEEQ